MNVFIKAYHEVVKASLRDVVLNKIDEPREVMLIAREAANLVMTERQAMQLGFLCGCSIYISSLECPFATHDPFAGAWHNGFEAAVRIGGRPQ
jgi:hypothetical protein